MQSFISYFEKHPQLTSTPVKVTSNTSIQRTKSSTTKQLRFSPSLEEYHYFSDDDVFQIDVNNQQTSHAENYCYSIINNQNIKNNDKNNINVNKYITNNKNIRDLINLQKNLSSITDRKIMKNIIRIIKRAGYLQVKESTYDFDLNAMDEKTIDTIRRCVE